MERDCVIGIDIGGTAIKCALVGRAGDVDEVHESPTPPSRGEDVLDQVLACAGAMRARAAAGNRRVIGAGLASPGILDEEKGVVHLAVNLGWREVPLRDRAAAHLRLPVVVRHDVRSAARAEAVAGSGRDAGDFLYVAISTGISAAWVRDGAVQAGAHGAAGELGHVQMRSDGERCGCGRIGCLETLASARAMETRYAATTGSPIAASEMVARMHAGDAVAKGIIGEATDWIAVAVANVAALLDPERIVLGGGFARSGEVLAGPVRAALPPFNARAEVVTSALGNTAGCAGAGIAAWDTLDLIGDRPQPAAEGGAGRPSSNT